MSQFRFFVRSMLNIQWKQFSWNRLFSYRKRSCKPWFTPRRLYVLMLRLRILLEFSVRLAPGVPFSVGKKYNIYDTSTPTELSRCIYNMSNFKWHLFVVLHQCIHCCHISRNPNICVQDISDDVGSRKVSQFVLRQIVACSGLITGHVGYSV